MAGGRRLVRPPAVLCHSLAFRALPMPSAQSFAVASASFAVLLPGWVMLCLAVAVSGVALPCLCCSWLRFAVALCCRAAVGYAFAMERSAGLLLRLDTRGCVLPLPRSSERLLAIAATCCIRQCPCFAVYVLALLLRCYALLFLSIETSSHAMLLLCPALPHSASPLRRLAMPCLRVATRSHAMPLRFTA